jgi:hypothetical protein
VPPPREILDRFLAIPNRDAYATIRGFVYQAVLTVQAWLTLSDNEILELESGEDIDWRQLAEGTVSSRRDADRVLGQVKYRRRGLSLRSETSLASLVNFHQHRLRNPQLHLLFRLLSNAKPIQERGHTHTSGLKGIELWSSLKTLGDPVERTKRLTFLRSVLLAPSEPAAIDRGQLADFRSFVRKSSNDEFFDFVRSFSWMNVSVDLEAAFSAAERAVSGRPELRGVEQAARFCLQALLYDTLVVLSQPGTKTLRPETCAETINSTLKEAAETVVAGLAAVRQKISRGADELGDQTQRLEKIVTELSERTQATLTGLATGGIAGAPIVIPGQFNPILERPNLVSPAAPRTRLRAQISFQQKTKCPVALIGDVACGKSQLALLAVSEVGAITWLSLRANEGYDPNILLDIAARQCVEDPHYEHSFLVAAQPESATLRALIIDDLEIGLASRGFRDRLPLVARVLRAQNVFVLACSTRRLPLSLQEHFASIHVGGYDDADIEVLLRARGAPAILNNDSVRNLISAVTAAHPLLVGALLQFLLQRGWKINDDVMEKLLDRSFAADVREEMQTRLLMQEGSGAKELLYRLSLSTRPITQKQALALAEIPPAVANGNEELTVLLDTWLQRSGKDSVLASPLISELGKKNLPGTTQRRIHDRLAAWMLEKKEFSQADAILCISHLLSAGKASGAGIILVQGLQAMLAVAESLKDTSLLMAWSDMALPTEMNLEVRVMIRGYQVALRGLLGKDVQYEFEDLLVLATQVSGDFGHLSVLGSCSAIAVHLPKKKPLLALHSARVALAHESLMSQEKRNELGTEFGLPDVLWLIGVGCTTRDETRAWLLELQSLSETRRAAMFNSHIAPESAWAIFEKFWLEEQKLPVHARDWASLMAFLEECEELAAKAVIPLLGASAFRAEQSIRILHIATPEDGDRLGWERSERYPKTGPESFLIAQGTAVFLTKVDRWDLALPWFNRAAECEFDGLEALRVENHLRRAEALFRVAEDAGGAFAHAEEIAESSESLGDLDLVVCGAEKAMWQWLTGDRTGCFKTWDRALELMITQDRNSTRWKNLFCLMGNHTSFFMSALLGEPPSPTITPAMMGLYLRDYDISNLYSEGSAWFVLAAMAFFADSLGEFEAASRWALKTVEIADNISADPRGKFVLVAAIPTLLRARDYDGMVNYSRESALTATIQPHLKVSDEMRILNPHIAEIEESWKPVDPEIAERWSIVIGVVPALLDILSASVKDHTLAYALLSSLTEKSLQIANKQNSPAWHAATKALTDLGTGSLDWSAEFASNSGEEGSARIRELLLAFGSGFACRRAPKDVFVQQVRWISWLKQHLNASKSLTACVVKSLAAYWGAVLEQSGFYFTLPRETKRELEAAQRNSLESVLRPVAKGLSLRLPQWLHEQLRES